METGDNIRLEAGLSADGKVLCPNGHEGPFVFIEAIEVRRHVLSADSGLFYMEGGYSTGEGYDDGIPGSEYLQCHHQGPTDKFWCAAEFNLPPNVELSYK